MENSNINNPNTEDAQSPSHGHPKQSDSAQMSDYKDWKITEETAIKMMKHRHDRGKDMSNIID